MTVALIVLDGFGLSDDRNRNALLSARMPNWDRLTAEWPHCRLDASGVAVGLPPGQMGNSEVGHLNLGAGFRVLQDLPRITSAIADGSFFTNTVLLETFGAIARGGGRLHLMGLVGPGGIHAVDEHIVAAVELAARVGLAPEAILFHAFTDGRDTPPRSADAYLPALDASFAGRAHVATVTGRYYAMDRDSRWERTRQAYDAIVRADAPLATSAAAAIAEAYARGENDEFIRPTRIPAAVPMADGDAVLHLNFRADRARQLSSALALDDFDCFERGPRPTVKVATLTEYQSPEDLPVRVAFPPLVTDSLAAHLARLGRTQLHVAETEKYAHVTYFFNGGVEEPLPGEERVLIPSNRQVPTYDLAPEMSAVPITDRLVDALTAGKHDFIVANYANPDMVGHTGVWGAGVVAAEVIDACLGRLADAALAAGATLAITADHGNIEEMRDEDGQPQTKHTTAPVPFLLVGPGRQGIRLRDGELADVAPTLCQLLGIERGPEMTGLSLIADSA